jgi:hypothetical protein
VLKANRKSWPTCPVSKMVPTSATQRGAGRLGTQHPLQPHQPVHHAPLNLQFVTLKRMFVASTLAVIMGAILK